jgi:hypothetical protein
MAIRFESVTLVPETVLLDTKVIRLPSFSVKCYTLKHKIKGSISKTHFAIFSIMKIIYEHMQLEFTLRVLHWLGILLLLVFPRFSK